MMSAGEADVIVIGSGPAGVSAAWPLVQAGVRVLMLDAADTALPSAPAHGDLAQWREDPQRWRAELGAVGPLADGDLSPKFSTPLARATLAGFDKVAGLDARSFLAVGSLAAGGLSNIWGALATRYGPSELARFPCEPGAMEASYARVAARIGISGGSPVTDAPAGSLTPPIASVAARHAVCPKDGLHLETAPNAVLAGIEREGRAPCNACGLCLHGCARGSIYQSAAELPGLLRHRNFVYRSGVRVGRLSGGPGKHVVEAHGVAGAGPLRFHAPVVVLATGTLMTTGLALHRLGLTGRPVHLESNPVAGMAFLVPRLIGAALPTRSFGLGQFFYTLQVTADVEMAGVFYAADTLPLAAIADRLPFTRPFALRTARALAPALILASGYLPGRWSDNRLTVEDDGAGFRLRIDGGSRAGANDLMRGAFTRLARHARRRGAWGVPGSLQLLGPGADAHPGATLPMGGHQPHATDADGELKGMSGVFVADGAALPFLSARHPTLTIMANADRIGHALAGRLTATASLRHAG